MYKFVKSMYNSGRMTAEQVWRCADKGQITKAQATSICGPRSKE